MRAPATQLDPRPCPWNFQFGIPTSHGRKGGMIPIQCHYADCTTETYIICITMEPQCPEQGLKGVCT
ncbi:hypothetical protein BDV28DRAFT_144268 [Aspergillus coremiiformis]|uniref:Uncharacterized protein n=1 Tax=Aspergillus coremiiformis TaxID=138285 RepID=A0A5N6YRK8_9EURO|nr:hypothetical protein BDV28DRAFT_144268 [Aspergillus coremiiformis]